MTDITFGDVEQATPQRALRPDRNAQFATLAHGAPAEHDLPVFVDLDVLCELETHALTNTNVELGGVLLGGQWVDDGGRPFVTITEAIRAEHYEATRGSFKFTHDTWSSISRRREELSPDLAMVGWYHTHPDWGVFLSGMDTFICENFFPRTHDVALVIDPCRGDRGIFQWIGANHERLSRVRGFYIMTSRLREAELRQIAAQLEGSAMPGTSFVGAPQAAPPVIQIVEPRGGGAQQLAVLGMLSIQFCFLVLLAWHLLAPRESGAVAERRQQETEVAARQAALDRVLDRLNTGTNGLAGELQKQDAENEKLRAAVTGYAALEQEKAALEKALSEARRTREELNGQIAELREAQSKGRQLAKDQATQIEQLKQRLGEGETDSAVAESPRVLWSVPLLLAGLVGVVLLAGGLALIVARRRSSGEETGAAAAEPLRPASVERKPVGVQPGD